MDAKITVKIFFFVEIQLTQALCKLKVYNVLT